MADVEKGLLQMKPYESNTMFDRPDPVGGFRKKENECVRPGASIPFGS